MIHKMELFISDCCISRQGATELLEAVRKERLDLQYEVVDIGVHKQRAAHTGVFIVPSFVLDEAILSVGVPKIGILLEKIRERITP